LLRLHEHRSGHLSAALSATTHLVDLLLSSLNRLLRLLALAAGAARLHL